MVLRLKRSLVAGLAALMLPLAACSPDAQNSATPGDSTASDATSENTENVEPFVTGAIPDQDPEELQRLYGKLIDYLEQELGVPVEYQPVTDYAAAVTAFKVGDLDMVWFGGLTGVQARLQVDGATAIAQRDIDENFRSVLIANTSANLEPFEAASGLEQLKGRTLTFGSESSTSGRLMPQFFMNEAGVELSDLNGEVGFSGNHDTTIKLVEAGSYEAGFLNEQVWESRLAEGAVNRDRVQVLWRTPTYYDYHWVISPDVEERYGEGFTEKVQQALLNLDPSNPEHQEILELFGAERFIKTENANYDKIEAVGREIGKIQ